MNILSFFKKRNIEEKKIIADCGHETKEKDTVTAFGESTITQLPIEDGKTPYCHRCIEKMAIKCAWCGHVIFIGNPITLYTPRNKDFEVPEHAVVYNEDPLQLVGCLRWDCAQTGADRAGFWLPPGKVQRVPTAIEMCMQDLKNGGSGVVTISDLSEA